eukprot:ANDGO_05121.mRNA.1 DNA-directed RNA polymerase III subunit RPC3
MLGAQLQSLIISIAHDDFGTPIAQIIKTLLLRGPSTIYQLQKFSVVSSAVLRESLVIMTCHSLVTVIDSESVQKRPAPSVSHSSNSSVYVYDVNVKGFLFRMLIPRVLGIVKESIGEAGLDAYLHVLTHGWISMQQLCALHPEKVVTDLVRERWIHRVSPIRPGASALSSPSTTSSTTTTSSSSSSSLPNVSTAAAANSQPIPAPPSKRRKVDRYAAAPTTMSNSVTAGPLSSSASVSVPLDSISSVLYSVNFEVAFKKLYAPEIISLVTREFSPEAARVMSALLRHERPQSLADILSILGISHINTTESDKILTFLEVMSRSRTALVLRSGNASDTLYTPHWSCIIERLRHHHTFALLREVFGIVGSRIVAMLISSSTHSSGKGRFLEQKTIVDASLSPPRLAKSVMVDLVQAGILITQDIPKSSDRSVLKSVTLFSVSTSGMQTFVQDRGLSACCWLRKRLSADRERAGVLLEAVKGRWDRLAPREREELEYYVSAENRLESAMIGASQILGLFSVL